MKKFNVPTAVPKIDGSIKLFILTIIAEYPDERGKTCVTHTFSSKEEAEQFEFAMSGAYRVHEKIHVETYINEVLHFCGKHEIIRR